MVLTNQNAVALAHDGNAALPQLQGLLTDRGSPAPLRRVVPKVLRRIGTPESLQLAIESLASSDDDVRHEALTAIERMTTKGTLPLAESQRDRVRGLYYRQTERFYQHLAIYVDLRRDLGACLLIDTLSETMAKDQQSVLRVLAILYPSREIDSIATSLCSTDRRARALGIALLEETLIDPLRPAVLAMLDDRSPEQRLAVGSRHFGIVRRTMRQNLRELLNAPNDWLRAVTIHQIAEFGLTELRDEVRLALDSPDRMVRQAAERALERLRPAGEY